MANVCTEHFLYSNIDDAEIRCLGIDVRGSDLLVLVREEKVENCLEGGDRECTVVDVPGGVASLLIGGRGRYSGPGLAALGVEVKGHERLLRLGCWIANR